MADLTSKERDKLPGKESAGHGRSFPGENIMSHARNAKARAAQMLKAGKITEKQKARIDARADEFLGKRRDEPPHPGARRAPDGKWYLADPNRPGKYLRIDPRG